MITENTLFTKKQEDTSNDFLGWRILQEEKMETKMLLDINKVKFKMLENFDNLFSNNYEKKTHGFLQLIKLLIDTDFNQRIRYDVVGKYRFKWFTIPITIRDFLNKNKHGVVPGEIIDTISTVDPVKISAGMNDNVSKSYMFGGVTGLVELNIENEFQVVDESGLKWLTQYENSLAASFSNEVSSKVRFEILEGMRNLESVAQIKKRIKNVWDETIDIVVPPKITDAGVMERAGYSYTMTADEWATIVARTEVSRAFVMGRLEAYKQMGVVGKVQWIVTADERLCPICGAQEGTTYKLEDANGVLPAHPSCRCTFVALINDFTSAAEQAKANIDELYG